MNGRIEWVKLGQPLRGARLRSEAGRSFTEAEVLERESAARQRGATEARQAAQQEIESLRAELDTLQAGVLTKLAQVESTLLAQVRDALPALTVDVARRLLAGFEPDATVVASICEAALAEVFPERANLELALCTRDAALLEKLNPDWLQKFPGLTIRPDASLVPGDCLVRSRFGLADARLATKVEGLEQGLSAA